MSHRVILEIESDLIKLFRSRDQRHIQIPRSMTFPLSFEDYFTWSEPNGIYQYLLFRKNGDGEPVGVVFDRSDAGLLAASAHMCYFCRSFGPGDEIDMLAVTPTSKNVIGIYSCIDLSCDEKLETTAKLSKKSFEKLKEELLERMTIFYESTFEKKK